WEANCCIAISVMASQQERNTGKGGKVAGMLRAKATRSRSIRRRPVFPSPDHDHDRCSSDAMAAAEVLCAQHGQRLTPIRRKEIATLLGTHKPLGAYEIVERLALKGPRPAPITPYPALELLLGDHLLRRVQRPNDFD